MADALEIPDVLTLPALQKHIHDLCVSRGWDQNTVERIFLLLTEEVGELAKATRRALKLQIEYDNPDKPIPDKAAVKANLAEELADVLCYLADIANFFNVDLDAAYRTKMSQVSKRTWK